MGRMTRLIWWDTEKWRSKMIRRGLSRGLLPFVLILTELNMLIIHVSSSYYYSHPINSYYYPAYGSGLNIGVYRCGLRFSGVLCWARTGAERPSLGQRVLCCIISLIFCLYIYFSLDLFLVVAWCFGNLMIFSSTSFFYSGDYVSLLILMRSLAFCTPHYVCVDNPGFSMYWLNTKSPTVRCLAYMFSWKEGVAACLF